MSDKRKKNSKGKASEKNAANQVADLMQSIDLDAKDPTIAALNKVMSDHSNEAHAMRKNITDRLEVLEGAHKASEPESDVKSLSATNHQIKQILEKTIKEKLAGLEEAMKGNPKDGSSESVDNVVNGKSEVEGKRTPKERTPEAIVPKVESKVSKTDVKASSEERTPAPQPGEKATVRQSSTSRPRKAGIRDKPTVESVMRGLHGAANESEKLAMLCRKYIDALEEVRTLGYEAKQQEKVTAQITKEREQLQADHNRSVLAKSRLEDLCRELQRQNKAVKEESLSKIKEEEEKRRDIGSKFQATLTEISQLVNENQQRNNDLKEENLDLAQKLKTLMSHYDNWEKNIDKIIQQKDLETQLLKAKLAKTNILLDAEKAQFSMEKEQLIQMIGDLRTRGTELAATEMCLRTELGMYTSKYEDFQNVLTKSNETFASFKKDMEKMSKQIKKLERETIQWKQKWESSNKQLADLNSEKQKRDMEYLASLQKIEKLEKICRALQEERIKMQSQIKSQSPDGEPEAVEV